jgi:hypothetical protein
MNNVISKIFFVAGLTAFGMFAVDQAQAFGVHDYSTHVIAILLLGILGHFAFERKSAP